jgi:hypothetical protein
VTVIESAVPMRIGAAVEEDGGEVVDATPRIVWLLDLVDELSADLMARCWRPGAFTALHQGVDSLGRKLPPPRRWQRNGWAGHRRVHPGCICRRGWRGWHRQTWCRS